MPRSSKSQATARPTEQPPISLDDSLTAIELLTKLLLTTRVRAVAGFIRDRCLACNHPHSGSMGCRSHCVHHEALAFLEKLGLKPDMDHRS